MAWFGKDKTEETKGKKSPVVAKNTAAQMSDASTEAPTLIIPESTDAAAYRAIKGPHVTEKATSLSAYNTYVFRVAMRANKTQIKDAIESLYNVNVTGVRTVMMPAKQRRLGRTVGTRSGFKKAIVTLKDGDSISVTA